MTQTVDRESSPRRCSTCTAQHQCLFISFPANLRCEIQSIVEMRYYSRRYTIFRDGQEAAGFYIVRSGWIKLFRETSSGRRRVVTGIAGPGTALGLLAVVSGSSYKFGAETLEDCELEYVPGDLFSGILSRNPLLAIDLLRAVGEQSQRSEDGHDNSGEKLPSAQRLLKSLEALADTCGKAGQDGIRLQIPMTVQDLADRIGCSRQWTTKLLNALEARRVLSRQQGWIVLMRKKSTKIAR